MKKRLLACAIGAVVFGLFVVLFSYTKASEIGQYGYLKKPCISELPTQNMLVIMGRDVLTEEQALKRLYDTYKSLKNVPKLTDRIKPRGRFLIYPQYQSLSSGKYALPLPSDVPDILLDSKISYRLGMSIDKWEYGSCAEVLHIGSYETKSASKKKLEDFINQNNYRAVNFYEEEYVRRPGLFGLLKPATILRYNVEKDEPVFQMGKAPLSIDFAYSELVPIRGNKRFNVTITFNLNKADSLYKQGARYLLYFIDNKTEGDSIESVNRKYAIIDDSNKKATFSIHLNKGNIIPHHSFDIGGGMLLDKIAFYKRYSTLLNGKHYLLSDCQPLKFGNQEFYIDYTAGYFIDRRFLQDWELKRYQ